MQQIPLSQLLNINGGGNGGGGYSIKNLFFDPIRFCGRQWTWVRSDNNQVSQIAFNNGIYSFVTQGFFWYLSYIIFALFITKKIKKFDAMTLPDLVGQMFGPLSQKLSALFNFINLFN
jgi:hypothetical protein